jgi:hypothetical protein
VSQHSRGHEPHDGSDAAPERPERAPKAHATADPPHPICRPTLQGHVARRHLWLALALAAMAAPAHVTR